MTKTKHSPTPAEHTATILAAIDTAAERPILGATIILGISVPQADHLYTVLRAHGDLVAALESIVTIGKGYVANDAAKRLASIAAAGLKKAGEPL